MVRRIKKFNRKKKAFEAQAYLESFLEKPRLNEMIRVNASKQIWKISTRHNIGLPNNIKNRFCRKCKIMLFPGVNSRIRIRKKIRCLTCYACGNTKRMNLGVRNE